MKKDLSKARGLSAKSLEKVLEKRDVTTVSLVEIMTGLLKEAKYEKAVKVFSSDKSIINIDSANTDMQRVIINRFFINKLLRFRANNDVPVTDMIVNIQLVIDVADWSKIYNLIVIPFLKTNEVL